MRRCCALGVVIGLLLLIGWSPGRAEAGDLFHRFRGDRVHQGQPPSYVGNPKGYGTNNDVAGTPGPHRYPGYDAARAPWYGYGFGVPTYNWGYFGAQYRPAAVTHHGYYGRMTQWSYRRGY